MLKKILVIIDFILYLEIFLKDIQIVLYAKFLKEKKQAWLDKNNIKYEREYKINKCKDKHVLRFDFCVFNSNNEIQLLIEYNGIQHYNRKSAFSKSEGTNKVGLYLLPADDQSFSLFIPINSR